jgi:hypothetical protein
MKKTKKKAAPKASKKKRRSIDTASLKDALSGLGSVVKRGLEEGENFNPDYHVDDMRRATEELQAAVEGFKREIKRRMLEDGIFETKKSKDVHAQLKLKPGRPEGSKDPDDYDMIVQRIH